MAVEYDEEQRPNRALGIVLLMVAVFFLSASILMSSTILAIFFSQFMPLITGLPAAAQTQINAIPAEAFAAYFVMVAGVFLVAVFGILRIVFGWGSGPE